MAYKNNWITAQTHSIEAYPLTCLLHSDQHSLRKWLSVNKALQVSWHVKLVSLNMHLRMDFHIHIQLLDRLLVHNLMAHRAIIREGSTFILKCPPLHQAAKRKEKKNTYQAA